MEISFWESRWKEGRIGFHQGKPNRFLGAHHGRLAKGAVLVPLCGKAEDLAFLAAEGHPVVGIEAVEDAVRAFFEEHGLTPEVTTRGAARVYRATHHGQPITLFAGDFFAVTAADVGPIAGFYDRAAMVALPEEIRRRYVPHLRALVGAGTKGLLVTFDYDQSVMEGPPFAISDAIVRELWGSDVLRLGEEPLEDHSRLRELGADGFERCYLVTA